MRKILVASLLSVGLTTVAAADVDAPPKVDLALKRALPNAKWKVEDGPRNVNGVGVYDVEVANKFGRTAAAITENGDFLVSPVPFNPDHLPGPVKHVIDHLFKNPPPEVLRFEDTNFVVGITAGGEDSDVIFDAVGRIIGVHSAAELRHTDEEFSSEGEDHRPETRHQMEDLVTRMEDKGNIDHVYKDPNFDGFFVVTMTDDAGKKITYITNGDEVFERKVAIDERELPDPVRQAVHGDLATDSIRGIVRRRYEFYQFDETCASGDIVTMKIDADGKILSVNSRGAISQEEEAKKNAHH